MSADPRRIGGLAWTRASAGHLTRGERRRLRAEFAWSSARYLVGRIAFAAGRVPGRARSLDPCVMRPPDSALAREAEARSELLPPSLAMHSYRTWSFGAALAALDGVELDRELLYVAALLHDVGLAERSANRCFTLAGADAALAIARRVALDGERADRVADAICAHINPRLTPRRDGELATYLGAASLLDVIGMRAWDLPPRLLAEAANRHPRLGFKRELARLWRGETDAVPRGRAVLARQYGLLIALRHAPFPDY